MEKRVCVSTQRYDAASGKVGKIFVATLSVELDGVQAWNWNSERVIVFQLFNMPKPLIRPNIFAHA